MTNHKLPATFFALILLFIVPFCTCAQVIDAATAVGSLRAIYRLEYKLDSAVITPKSEQMVLKISNGASFFRSNPEYVHDSVYFNLNNLPENERTKAANDAARKVGKTEVFYTVFKEPAKNLVFYHDNIGSVDHQISGKNALVYLENIAGQKDGRWLRVPAGHYHLWRANLGSVVHARHSRERRTL